MLIRATPNTHQSGPPCDMIDLCKIGNRGQSVVYGMVHVDFFHEHKTIYCRLYNEGQPVMLDIRLAEERKE